VAGVPRTTEKLLKRLESAKFLDGAADVAARLLRPVIRPGVVEDTLTGKQLGHPAHPAVVAVPIGAWTLTHVFDATGDSAAASRAQAVGILAALPAAATGASDWLTTLGAERRVGLAHAALNYTALSLHATSWLQRRKGRDRVAALLAVGATSLVGASGWLGGHLAYALGVGVDTTVFQHFPGEWVDAVGVDEVPATGLHRAEVAGVPILFARNGGRIVAYSDRCTHRGAPLDEGSVQDGCVTCPWHGSVFSLADGSVVSGPATRPQPQLEVEVQGSRVRVRRPEERTLRTNPIGR
jgi:nitrite reductase/ring-hydroxylating ferredoxin subunit/uncharacterized membrane protein